MENKLGRFFRNTGPARFLLPIGIILLIIGIILVSNAPKEYAETSAVVTSVSESLNDDNEKVYDAEYEYTVDGKKYTGIFSELSDPVAVGDTLTVYYDAENPEHSSNTKDSALIGTVMIVLGAAAVVGGVLGTVKAFKRSREMDEKTMETFGTLNPASIPVPDRASLTEYYVSFDGNTLKPGYIVEDASRQVVFEAPMTKNSLVTKRIFTFTDRTTGESVEHEVGHTTTTQYDNEFFSMSSWFSFDGENIWDVLHDKGIRFVTDMRSSFPRMIYTAYRNGQFFATIETAGRFVHEEDEAEHKLNIPVGSYYYRVWTDSKDLPSLFLTVFALSESEQTVVE